jgi:hypothetical protein
LEAQATNAVMDNQQEADPPAVNLNDTLAECRNG